MALQVFTSRIACRDPDRFDITRKSGGNAGSPFAPSWKILQPALTARREAAGLMREAVRLAKLPETAVRENEWDYAREAERLEEAAWAAYEPAFIEQMRRSYRVHRGAWDELLRRERVVLVCYCPSRERCHRGLLASRILPALGAADRGELEMPRRANGGVI